MKKKLITALLLGSLLLPSLAGCVSDTPPTNESSASTESSDETTSAATNDAWKTHVEQVNALYGEKIARTGLERYSISIGKTVTASRTFEGDAALVTDGDYVAGGTEADAKAAIYFNGREDTELVLDLGETVTGIGDFALGIISSTELDASLPRQVDFYASADGETYVKIGVIYRTRDVLADQSNLYDLKLQNGISVRYIKAVIPQSAFISDTLYIDEFSVFQYREGSGEEEKDMMTDNYYQNEPLPDVTSDEYWDATESDYNDEGNLVSGLSYRIISGVWIDSAFQTDYYNTPVSNPALTDGNTASASYGDSKYFHFTRFVNRTIIFDLGKVSGITGATVGYLFDEGVGIKLPSNVAVMGSMNGTEWGEIASGKPEATQNTAQRVELKLDFEKTEARFVAVKMTVDSHVWLDEIQVFGTKNAEGAAELVIKTETEAQPNQYISPEVLGGTENLMLMYTFKNENRDTGLNTVEELLPYVAYYDTEGKMADTFFDSFLFLPCSTTCPSGGHLYYDKSAPSRMTDWLAFEDDLFYENCNVNGLELAAEEMDRTLGTDSDIPIYFSIFSTVHKDKGFGDVDGDGVDEDFSNIADRKKVIKWWIDRLIARYESGAYENLRLDGFYWYHEAMETSDPHELELVRYTADYLHSLGYYFIWIPYYQATGYADWQSYGFDAAIMQPNYMFSDNVTEDRLYYNAEYTKALGMGVEIEADYGVISDKAKLEKYRAYLRVGVETGYMHSIKMYYQDGGPGVFYGAYRATDPAFRSVYDDTYKYAKGTLTVGLPELASTTFEGKAGQAAGITLEAKDGTTMTPELYLTAKYGSVKAAGDGKFIYYPPEGFTGTDTFVVKDKYSNDNEGVAITVVIE